MPASPREMYVCMEKDLWVWGSLDNEIRDWERLVVSPKMYTAVGNFILQHRPGESRKVHPVLRGGYNVVYRLEYADGSSVALKVPIKGIVRFPDEKIRYEVATMRYVAANTTIPVPKVYHHGKAEDNPTGLGPFIMMEWIDHHQHLCAELLDRNHVRKRPILDPAIPEEKLEFLYGQMANIVLQLSSLKFPRIGSLVEEEGEETASVKGRPLIVNMNEVVIHTSSPASILPDQTYDTAHEWYKALGNLHMAQLLFQHNDAVDNEEDARHKYVARQLFRKVADEQKLIPMDDGADKDFRLFSEDLRPSNVLIDKDMKVVGVIDWEFAYAAPAQFTFDPPWWLLLLEPEYWEGGPEKWVEDCEPRFRTFLRALEAEEAKTAAAVNGLPQVGAAAPPPPPPPSEPALSQRMRESWEKRTWVVNYAARKSWAFDFLWWAYLDERFFGPNLAQDCSPRLGLLTSYQRDMIEWVVARKMDEKNNRDMLEWHDDEAEVLLVQVLG